MHRVEKTFANQDAGRRSVQEEPVGIAINGVPAIEDREGLVLLDEAAVAVLERDVGTGRLAAVLTAFAGELTGRAELLQAALEKSDMPAIGRESHSIKGSALTFGTPALGHAARRTNDACRAGDHEGAIAAAREVLTLMPRTGEAVARLLANRTGDRQR